MRNGNTCTVHNLLSEKNTIHTFFSFVVESGDILSKLSLREFLTCICIGLIYHKSYFKVNRYGMCLILS